MLTRFGYFLFLLLASRHVNAGTYQLTHTYVGDDFLNQFVHETIQDPTHGRTNYVDQPTALAQNLTYVSSDTLILSVDATTELNATSPGRNSIRISSIQTFTTHVAVFDVRHMPEGCATWPAVWETSETDWPNFGEVDIARIFVIEGVNDQPPNQSTLHTGPNCAMPPTAGPSMTGTLIQADCDVSVNQNAGCGVQAPTTDDSFGPAFNAGGGGWYAMERTTDIIQVWFWARNDTTVLNDLESGADGIVTDNWGVPVASFPASPSCDLDTHFGQNSIIINIALCGDWAGNPNDFAAAGCPGDCFSYANYNPESFVNAYWDFASVRVYE